MKKMIVAVWLLAAAGLFGQSGDTWEPFDLIIGRLYNKGNSRLTCMSDENSYGMFFQGTVSTDGAGYAIDEQNLGLNSKRRIMIRVSGISQNDLFDMAKLLKLEINEKAVRTVTERGRNRNDPDYINARNGECIFDISEIQNITKLEIVFYNCTMGKVLVELFTD